MTYHIKRRGQQAKLVARFFSRRAAYQALKVCRAADQTATYHLSVGAEKWA